MDEDDFNDAFDESGSYSDDGFFDDDVDDGFGDDGFGSDDDDNVAAAGHVGLQSDSKLAAPDFMVLNSSDVKAHLDTLVSSVTGVLGVDEPTASLLLRSYKWNKETLMTKFLEQPEKTNRHAGLIPQLESENPPPTPNANGQVVCMICQDSVALSETYALACKHPFCRTCWKGYLAEKMEHGKLAAQTRCPMFKCPMIMRDSDVEQLADASILSKYNRFVLKSFVEDSRLMRWCPAARCDYVVKVSSGAVKSVRCRCGTRFCFKCDEEAHDPVSCEQLQEWLDKCRNESETAHWIIANTRKCPKCNVRIEKNSGCNHMICQSCKYEFCWVCMGDWAEHGNHTGGFYKCNKYNPKRKKKKKAAADGTATETDPDSEDAKEEAKAELDRYIHYFTRYSNHEQSKQWAVRQMETTNRRMAALQGKSNESAWIDVQFLGEATAQVFECRAVLKHTYVFGYYLEDGPEKELFEFLQQNLEKSTEMLSELSEQPLDTLDQAEVANYTRVTKKFMHNLLDGISNGLTQLTTQ